VIRYRYGVTRSAGGGAAGEGRTADPDGSAQSDDGNVVPNSIDVDAVEDPSPDRASGDGIADDGNGDDEDEEIELDLTDPSDVTDDDADGDDDDDAEEFDSGGDHGVPDSL
jgi:hypothetical protein